MADTTSNDPALRQQLDLLYREHHGWLSAFLRKRMGCSQGAADLAQDTYLRILSTGLPHGIEQPRGFLARIARGLVIDRYRRKRIEAAYLEQIALYPQEQVPSPETRLLVIETLIELDRLLDELPGRVRQAFLLHRLDGLSYREIAERLGVSVSSVEKYIARGLQACLLASLESEAMSVQVKPEIARQAAQWMARLWAEDVSSADQQACRNWREASLEHERAWQVLQQLQGRFDNLGRQGAGSRMLVRSTVSRRQLLALGGLALGGAAVLGLPRTTTWQQAMADHQTSAGQVRGLVLTDGSRLYLNTRTRLDLQEHAGQQRLHLHEGELLLDMTTRDASTPFSLGTQDGTLHPHRARVSLRFTDGISRIGVYQGEADWDARGGQRIGLSAGQALLFGNGRQLAHEPSLASDTAWMQGKLVAERMPLDRFITELGRYRPGLLRGDPALARLQVTGVFSVTDTDLALEQLTRILPVRVSRMTRYWVQVSPA